MRRLSFLFFVFSTMPVYPFSCRHVFKKLEKIRKSAIFKVAGVTASFIGLSRFFFNEKDACLKMAEEKAFREEDHIGFCIFFDKDSFENEVASALTAQQKKDPLFLAQYFSKLIGEASHHAERYSSSTYLLNKPAKSAEAASLFFNSSENLASVCRHKSAIINYLLQHYGFQSQIAYYDAQSSNGHAWVELTHNGKVSVIDSTNFSGQLLSLHDFRINLLLKGKHQVRSAERIDSLSHIYREGSEPELVE